MPRQSAELFGMGDVTADALDFDFESVADGTLEGVTQVYPRLHNEVLEFLVEAVLAVEADVVQPLLVELAQRHADLQVGPDCQLDDFLGLDRLAHVLEGVVGDEELGVLQFDVKVLRSLPE